MPCLASTDCQSSRWLPPPLPESEDPPPPLPLPLPPPPPESPWWFAAGASDGCDCWVPEFVAGAVAAAAAAGLYAGCAGGGDTGGAVDAATGGGGVVEAVSIGRARAGCGRFVVRGRISGRDALPAGAVCPAEGGGARRPRADSGSDESPMRCPAS